MEMSICPHCDEYFESYRGKIYCNRNCKVNAKQKRKSEFLKEERIKAGTFGGHPYTRSWKEDPSRLYKNYEKTKIAVRRRYMMKTFGITLEEAAEMKAKQKCCDICGTTDPRGRDKRWHIDHIKDTKIIRGLLCNNCNLGIGFLRHDLEVLRNAIKYLDRNFIK